MVSGNTLDASQCGYHAHHGPWCIRDEFDVCAHTPGTFHKPELAMAHDFVFSRCVSCKYVL